MKVTAISLLLSLAALLSSCQTAEEQRPRRRLQNPGDELDVKAWNRPTRSSQVGTPFGLPASN